VRPTTPSAKRRLPLLVVAIAAPLALVAACDDAPAPRPASAPSSATPGERPALLPTGGAMLWKTLGTWSGHGDRQTESFDVTSGSLRLTWEATGDPGEGHLRVALHSSISGRPLESVVEASGPGADTVHLAAEPRVAYLLIEADRVDWRLTLEEGMR
jgi:hypothetical protein